MYELGDGGSPRHLNTFSNLFMLLYTTHISTQDMIVDCTMYTMLPTTK